MSLDMSPKASEAASNKERILSSKTTCRGFESYCPCHKVTCYFCSELFFCLEIDKMIRTREGLSVKKIVRWTVFSEEREAGTEIRRIWVAERLVCKA